MGRSARTSLEAAAVRCFASAGFHGTSVRRLAEEAGVSLPALYQHFGSKLGLLEHIVLSTLERCDAHLRAAARRSNSPSDAVTSIVEAGVDFHREHAAEVAVAYAEVRTLDGLARRRAEKLLEAQVALMRDEILAGVGGGQFGTPEPLAAARAAIDCIRASAPMPGLGAGRCDDGPALSAFVLAMLRPQ